MVDATGHESQEGGGHVRRRRFSWTPLKLSIAIATLFLVACGGEATATPRVIEVTVIVAGTPVTVEVTAVPSKMGGTVVMATEHPQGMVPILAGNLVDEYSMALIYDSLTRPDPVTLDPINVLAESWETSADGLTWTFKLKSGIKWSDGQPLTATDVKFSWEMLCNPGIPGNIPVCEEGFNLIEGAEAFIAGDAAGISGIEVLDDLTFRFKMTRIHAPLLSLMTVHFIVPEHVLGSIPAEDMGQSDYALGKGTIGTGPFVMEYWTQNESLGVRAKEDYWQGRPNLDAFVIRWCLGGQRATAFTQLKVGEINLMAFFCNMRHDDAAEAERDPAISFTALPGAQVFAITFNLNKPPFDDVRFRRALSYMMDRDAIGQGLYTGRWDPHTHPIPPSFTWAFDANISQPNNDIDKGLELFGEMGYTKGSDGLLRNAAGETIQFEMSHYPSAFQFAPALHAQWREAGIDATVQFYEWAAFFFPIYLEGKHGMLVEGNEFGGNYHPIQTWFSVVGDAELNGWPNAQAYTDLVDATNVTLDLAVQGANMKALDKLFTEDLYMLLAGWPDDLWGHTANLVLPEASNGKAMMRVIKDFYYEQ